MKKFFFGKLALASLTLIASIGSHGLIAQATSEACSNFKTYYTGYPGIGEANELFEVAIADGTATFTLIPGFSTADNHIALDNEGLIYAVRSAYIDIFDPATGTYVEQDIQIKTLTGENLWGFPTAIIDSDGTLWIGRGANNTVYSVEFIDGEAIVTPQFTDTPVNGGDLVVTVDANGNDVLWLANRLNNLLYNLSEGTAIGMPLPAVNGVSVRPDGQLLLSNGSQSALGGLYIWNPGTDELVALSMDGGPEGFFNGDLAGRCIGGDDDNQEPEPVLCYGAEILNFVQGPKTNGQPVAADRSNPEVALGAPALNNSAGSFVSLGVGGFIEIGFEGVVFDLPGNDILVVETSFSGNNCGSNDDEFADIALSMDGINYVEYGTICRNEEIDIAVTGLPYVVAIRITNSDITNTPDGYDVDGVVALHGCEDFSILEPGDDECFAYSVLEYNPVGNIPANRMNPEKALGAPQRDNTFNFVSLGFGGSLILGFDGAAVAMPGVDDLEVVETTFNNKNCQSYEERANVYVSQQVVADASEIDDNLFEYVGQSCTNGAFFDVYAETGFEYFTLVKIVDVTPLAAQLPNRDGYDVDGIVALHGCDEVPEQPEEICEGTWRTQTQGGWGSPANGNNPGVYRNANFDAAFPNGLVIGCANGNTLTLTSAAAVQAFLPSGGQPSALSGDLVNPTSNKGSFAGNLTALALSLGFDAYDAEFSQSSFPLSNLVIQSGTFSGLTVGELFAIANDVIGGCSTAYTPQQVNSAVDNINNAYTDGVNQNSGFVSCEQVEPEIVDPFCTNSTVAQQHNVTDGNVRLTAMGNYQECSGEYGYRWRIRNESGEPRIVFYNFASDATMQGPFNLEGDEEVYFTTAFGAQVNGGGTMRIFVNQVQVDVKAHGGSTKNLADCGVGCPDTPPAMQGAAVPNIEFTAYPNPSSGPVSVTFSNDREEMVSIEVMDMSGRVVESLFRQVSNPGQHYRIDFEGSRLPNGVYLTRLTTPSEVLINKIMIAK